MWKRTSKISKMYKIVPLFLAAFFVPVIVYSLVVSNNGVYADTTVGANVTRPAYSLFISVEPQVSLAIVATSNGVMTVGQSTVQVGTNSDNGYRLYLGMTGTSNALIHTTDSTKQLTSSGTFEDPVALTNSTWGYAIPSSTSVLLSTNGFDESYTTQSSASPTSAKFASIPVSTATAKQIAQSSSAGDDDIPVYYGVRAGFETPTGTFQNTVIWTALADDSPTPHIAVASPSQIYGTGSEVITVSTPLFTTASSIETHVYELTADEYDTVVRAQNPIPVTYYDSSELTCTDLQTDAISMNCTNQKTTAGNYYLYVDVPHYGEYYVAQLRVADITDITNMQQMTSQICAATAIGTTTTLTDARGDNQQYTIRKHEDGNCWMTQNLRLGSTSSTITLTPDDSNVTSTYVLPIAQNSGSSAWSDASNSTNSEHVYAQTSTTYGHLYNWYTATAGTGLGTMKSTSASNLDNATDSICPKGWRLPDGGTSTTKSWYALDIALGGNGTNRTDATQRDKFINAPYSFPYSGYYNYGGGLLGQGSNGYWWSRSAYTTAGLAYSFSLYSGGYVYPQGNSYVGRGFTVRCVSV